jgi:uncharacterized membrane protein HdeD (DUF308 family)
LTIGKGAQVDQSAAYDAGRVVGTIVGYLLIYGGILALGVFFGKRIARKRGSGFVRWPLQLAIGVVVLLVLGQCAGRNAARAAPTGIAQGVT